MNGKVRGLNIVFEIRGFSFELEPSLAVGGKLKKPIEIAESTDGFKLKFDDGSGFLRLSEASPDCLKVETEVEEGYSRDGVLAKMRCKATGCRNILLYHFTFDPEKYFGEAEEPYSYPKLRAPGEKEYCAWSYPVHLRDFRGVPKGLKVSQMLMKGDDAYFFLLPVSTEGARGFITEVDDGFSIMLDREAEGEWSKALLAVFSVCEDPYRAIEKAYEACFETLGKAHVLRRNKTLAEPFRFLGWCSWNSMWLEPSEQAVLKVFEALMESGIKPGFFLIDDGWQDDSKTESGARAMRSFEPNSKKFPRGFEKLVKSLKAGGVKYVGLWHTLNLHWGGCAKGSRLADEIGNHLIESGGLLIPNPDSSFDLYRKLYNRLRRLGFDFVKVDNQSFVGYGYSSRIPIEEAARKLHEGLEGAAHVNGLEVLNCMAQQPENQFNWLRSTVSRNCVDYIVPHKRSRNKLHLYFNAYNSLWMSQLVWPDWDMFQSHDPWALQQAVARAVSGGPVYITDVAEDIKPEVVKPLAFSDSRLPLPDHPALPTEDSIMRDPYNEPLPLKVFTRITVKGMGIYGVVASFNINRDDEVVEGSVSPSDALLRGERFLAYEYFTGDARLLRADEELPLRIEPMGTRLHIFSPLGDDLTAIGLRSIYLMPRGIVSAYPSGKSLLLETYEPGEVLIWSMKPLKAEVNILEKHGNLYCVKSEGTILRVEI